MDNIYKLAIYKVAKSNKLIRAILYPLVVIKSSLCNKTSIQNKLFDNLCQIIDGDLVIKISEFKGKFLMDCRSDLFRRVVRDNEYEPKLVQSCLKYLNRNRDVIDIGANVGFYTVLFGKELQCRKILAIEPTKNALFRLHKNILLNNLQISVLVFEGVVSNCSGLLEIHTIAGKEEYSSLGCMDHPSISNNNYETIKVLSSTIDNLVNEYSLDPGFIKIDVEGMEHRVLEGMKNTLLSKRPVILSELSDFLLIRNGSSAKSVIDFIKDYNYDVIDPLLNKMPSKIKNISNILCIPK